MRYDTAQNMNSCFTVCTPGVSYNMMCIDYKQYCSFPVYILSIWFRCWRLETLTYFGLLCYFHAHKTENKEISTGPPCMKSDYRLVSTWYILYTRHLVTFTSMSAMGGAVSGSLAGTAVAYIMSLVGWKSAGVAERYVGATPLHHGEKRKRESRTGVHGRERPTYITRFRKTVRSVPTRGPLRYGSR